MTRPIGDVFEYEGVQLKVVQHKHCIGCYFNESDCFYRNTSIIGKCGPMTRLDRQSVIFVKTSQEQIKSEPLKLFIHKKKITLNFD